MKKNLILALFTIVAILIFGCRKEEETGSIYGTVTDFATGEPVKNANVKLNPDGMTTLTGSDGTYTFQELKPGEYTLTFSKAEYETLNDDYAIQLASGKNFCRDVQMVKKASTLRITDLYGNDITVLDFGIEQAVVSKSFNIFNNGTISVTCSLSYNCNWITSVTSVTEPIASGQTKTVVVEIDRSRLAGGLNTTLLQISSNNGSNELEIRAEGIGPASVTTANATDITANTATCGGEVTSDGSSTVTDRGVCWALTQSPSLENSSHLSMGNGTGSFSNTITGLSPNTPYYVRAYATNGYGTSYGEQKMFTTTDGMPTVTTTTTSNISTTTATSGGNVLSNGGYPVTARGICWNTTGYPDINDTHTTNGTGNGSFTANMTGLTTSTTYHVRAYATNSMGTSYGADKTFTTSNGLPVISISPATNLTATSAVLTGNVTNDYGSTVTEKGFCWSTNQYPTTSDSHISVGTGIGTFTSSATNLTRNTTYYVRAYATNSYGTNYSSQISFQTTSGLPDVTTTNPTLNGTTVTTGGNVSSDGGYAVTARGICYGNLPYPDLTSTYSHTTDGNGTGYFSSTFPLPVGSGTYYIRAYATNANGTSYGEQKTIVHPYEALPTFSFDGHTYKVAPCPNTSVDEYMSWPAANNYCEGLTLYGYSDWRMPTLAELQTMYSLRSSIGGWFEPYTSSTNRPCYHIYWSSNTCHPSSCSGGYSFVAWGTGQSDCSGCYAYLYDNGYYCDGTAYCIVAHVRPIRIDN